MKLSPDAPSTHVARKPRVALAIATGFGLGYLPLAPGTWGSLGGLALVWGIAASVFASMKSESALGLFLSLNAWMPLEILVAALIAAIGVWVSGSAARYLRSRDPQVVVIDEVSGQGLALLIGTALKAGGETGRMFVILGDRAYLRPALLNWKYLLLGLILFRVFDIWKPFPVRQAEKLPGGWGIMADDWAAAVYAGLGLWLARVLGL